MLRCDVDPSSDDGKQYLCEGIGAFDGAPVPD
jgi:hypothetical protein